MERQRAGLLLSASGVLLVVISIVGWFAGASTEASAPAPTTTAAADTTTTAAAPTATTAVAEPVEEFFERWEAALASGDVEFLVQRLHPGVVTTYGQDQCRAYLAGVAGEPITVEVRSVGEPAPGTLGLDGIETPIADVQTVELYRSDQDKVVPVRVVAIDGEIRWFTDCGDPVATS